MWLFLSDSMMMPSLAPMDKADPKLTLGRRTLQIRGRLRSHLENFIENYGEGLDFSEVEDNPYADYTCRFYATPEAFGEAMKRAVMDIDYKKFKDTAERPRKLTGKVPEKAKEYHSVLLSVWSTTQRVNRAGGFYGAWSPENPRGYRPRTGRRFGERIGDSFGPRDHEPLFRSAEDFDDIEVEDLPGWWDDEDQGWVPDREVRAQELLEEMSDIPVDQWEDELTTEDYDLIESYIPAIRRQQERQSGLEKSLRRRDKREKRAKRQPRHRQTRR